MKAPVISTGRRSKFEDSFALDCEERGYAYAYEPGRIPFIEPAKTRWYTPDWVFRKGDPGASVGPLPAEWFLDEAWCADHLLVETKGRWKAPDRKKHLFIKEQHPHVDIRFVFQRLATPIAPGSKTTVAAWAERNGFKFSEKYIPEEWFSDE